MSVINTNVSSLIAQNALAGNARAQSNAMQQLSTGLRINGAKDDAAGLAIAAKMTSQIKGLDQAVRNGNDAISMLQTADGAMSTVADMLQRMRELSVQAASDTNVTTDRQALQNEFNALSTEIGRVGATTQWNGMGLLDGTNSGSFNFQLGANNNTAAVVNQQMLNIATSASGGTAKAITQAGSEATQVSTTAAFAIGDLSAGASINTVVNGKTYSYTVTATDLLVGTDAQKVAGVLSNTANAYAAQGLTAAGSGVVVDSTTAAGKLTFTATAGGTFNAASFGVATNVRTGGAFVTGDITSQSGALTAIDTTTARLQTINTARSTIGATINRLTYAVDNLSNVSQNTSASRSRVQDTDYAKASTELARTQIISQAATAMLAQANQSQQSVLALLK